MGVISVVILMVLFTSVLQVDGSYYTQFYQLQKVLESALLAEETLYAMRQAFFAVMVHGHAQEVQQMHISICVEITVDTALNSTSNALCIASLRDLKVDENDSNNSSCWEFLWTNSALLSLITNDQLVAFDVFITAILGMTLGHTFHYRHIDASLPLICSDMPNANDIKTSLMLLLSWSKSYARHRGVPPQWEETDEGYIQELYEWRHVAESAYNENDVHLIRLELIISFAFLNILVVIIVLSYGKQCYMKVYRITSGSTRLAAVTWAFMTTALFLNFVYLFVTLNGLSSLNHSHPRVWKCLISDADWCASMKLTKLYSDEEASLLIKLTVVPLAIGAELLFAIRLTSHTLLLFPCTMASTSQCCSYTIGKRILQTILIWNAMIFIQVIFGVILLPLGVLMVIVPVTALSVIGTLFLVLVIFTVLITYVTLQWCDPISFKRICSLFFCFHIFSATVILLLIVSALSLYYFVIQRGVEPWSVKGSIFSLLPSFLFTPLLWFVKRYFFKKDRVIKQDDITIAVHNLSSAHSEKRVKIRRKEGN